MDSLQDRRLIKAHKRWVGLPVYCIYKLERFILSIVTCRFCYKENRGEMARLTDFLGLMLILSCGTICSSALSAFSLEDKLQELELRLEAKIEDKNAQLE
jgi:hypothetical protein